MSIVVEAFVVCRTGLVEAPLLLEESNVYTLVRILSSDFASRSQEEEDIFELISSDFTSLESGGIFISVYIQDI